ncbi:HSF-type DNA-binding-domain-containing protein [Fomitopsis serialis]|uniref:HSF-type DNA-binding-domain-containing protein n=1 Tax=Fomitopsis serialis TaxID=139415 RepID=UPI00200744C9|nr:HSF-type DNA-binding-domain-containing protein [Neoantrodia serialis]KAH9930260.1 HSF-type DNA-binding-domain-containing protein [Neoantrodia serialis]
MNVSVSDAHPDRASLSLNLSSLSVASPTNMSPINPSPHPSTQPSSHVSPITPISPSGLHAHHAHHHPGLQPPFSFAPPGSGADHASVRYEEAYDYSGRRLTSSRSSSSSDKSVPRKRSFPTVPALSTNIEEPYGDHSMDASPYDEVDMNYGGLDTEGSPVDGSTSGGEQDDHLKPLEASSLQQGSASQGAHGSMPPQVGMLGKPLGTNNFVTKLYQMINDPKSAQFIQWTELGTSFVVSNVGEFSRTILGSHFKHNNFSSFVRQLNMYGFHKINRTPRAQRTSADVQTWEFSHHKFLRGRPDLLEEIKRKALEPDPATKHRVELPGEVAAQLAQVREENRRLSLMYHAERGRVERLAGVTKAMYEVVQRMWPGTLQLPFPADLLEPDNPNIYITSPNSATPHAGGGGFLPSLSMSGPAHAHTLHHTHSLHSLGASPGSSPTTADFPHHAHGGAHHSHHHSQSHTPASSLSRQHSFQHLPYESAAMHSHHGSASGGGAHHSYAGRTPLPPSPGPMDLDERVGGAKRQRTAPSSGLSTPIGGLGGGEGGKKSRARSDSAPLGYGALGSGWGAAGRPRSGSGLGSGSLGAGVVVPGWADRGLEAWVG